MFSMPLMWRAWNWIPSSPPLVRSRCFTPRLYGKDRWIKIILGIELGFCEWMSKKKDHFQFQVGYRRGNWLREFLNKYAVIRPQAIWCMLQNWNISLRLLLWTLINSCTCTVAAHSSRDISCLEGSQLPMEKPWKDLIAEYIPLLRKVHNYDELQHLWDIIFEQCCMCRFPHLLCTICPKHCLPDNWGLIIRQQMYIYLRLLDSVACIEHN